MFFDVYNFFTTFFYELNVGVAYLICILIQQFLIAFGIANLLIDNSSPTKDMNNEFDFMSDKFSFRFNRLVESICIFILVNIINSLKFSFLLETNKFYNPCENILKEYLKYCLWFCFQTFVLYIGSALVLGVSLYMDRVHPILLIIIVILIFALIYIFKKHYIDPTLLLSNYYMDSYFLREKYPAIFWRITNIKIVSTTHRRNGYIEEEDDDNVNPEMLAAHFY
uniref:Uncharacterized protein n=1 Tax=Parastrongyloides trichosuri TaxID=131310 RepID=A0A0N4ZBX0_PARTI